MIKHNSAPARRETKPRALRIHLLLTVAAAAAAAATVAATATGPATAQDAAVIELPEVIVKAPTPVAKPKKPARASSPAATPAPSAAVAASAEPDPVGPTEETVTPQVVGDRLPGTLLVVDDAFVPVTVITEREIETTRGATLTETLQTKPGISGTTFTAGSNRPIIRGLDTYRVRVQENGIGSGDVAALSEDHAVPIDPYAASRVEVIRGPATLRYGSQAIGGVVAVENDRIPSVIPNGGFSGEIRGGISSVDEGRDGAFRATAGANGIAVHADGFKRSADDYDTPRGRQLNTFVDSEGGALGISMIGVSGFLGVSVSRFESVYGIPGEEAVEDNKRIDLEQDKLQVKGEWRVQDFGIEAFRVWFGASDYAHDEVVEDGEVGSRFTNEEYEGRLEMQHLPIVTSLGTLRGAIGTQFVSRNMSGIALEEANSLLEPSETDSIAAFIFEELDVTRNLTLQAALRIEHTKVDGFQRIDTTDGDSEFTDEIIARSRDFTPVSVSLGGLYRLPGAHVVSLNGQYVERAPDAAELFSGGIHEATETFEIGNANLELEKAMTIEAGLRKATGAFRYDATAFYTKFDGFIFKGIVGECGDFIGSCGVDGEDELAWVVFDQRDATFYGVEIAAQYDVSPIWNGVWGIEGQYDFVNAEFSSGEDVPRIPPHRLGGGFYYRDVNWFARAGVLHAFDQNRFAGDFDEIATPGYTLVSAEISYTARMTGLAGLPQEITIGLTGENLADDDVLNHASFKRGSPDEEEVFLPGASVRLFGSIKLN